MNRAKSYKMPEWEHRSASTKEGVLTSANVGQSDLAYDAEWQRSLANTTAKYGMAIAPTRGSRGPPGVVDEQHDRDDEASRMPIMIR
jgi:hypothetical protein